MALTKVTSGAVSGLATSATTDTTDAINITTGTIPTARLDTGTSANKLVQLDSTGKLPAISGANLTGVGTVTKSTTAPSSPAQGDMWFDSTGSAMKVWSGSDWDTMSNKFTASGGTESTYSSGGVNYKVHTFTSSGTFIADSAGSVDVLVVAGGGGTGAGRYHNGGGGAGGVLYATNYTITAASHTITVGGGGAGGTHQLSGGTNPNPAPYNNGGGDDPGRHGNPSSFGTIATALGGGYGGTYNNTYGGHGGSGGGAPGHFGAWGGTWYGNSIQTAPAGFTAYGNRGGAKPNSNSYSAGGGGGAGEIGNTNGDCDGGDGMQFDIRNGTNVYYAGGGGGSEAVVALAGAGGAGGGGDGSVDHTGTNGTANTGGGGGGIERQGSGGSTNGTTGGSGIVIVRYAV